MSARLVGEDVRFMQRMYCACGLYSSPFDGVWREELDEADAQLEAIAARIAATSGLFDSRSERNIRTLHPKAQELARVFLARCRDAGLDARIISGTRSYAEQDALYRIGRFRDTNPRVTNARGGESNHNFGIAWDIGLFEGGRYITTTPPYERAAAYCPEGVEWGGAWKRFPDPPHYQLAVGFALAEVRARFEAGRPFINL